MIIRSIIVLMLLIAASRTHGQESPILNETPATYSRGDFFEYIRSNIRYPADALADSTEGFVLVEFKISESGAVISDDVRVEKSLSISCDAEALRLIRSSPEWIPARRNGEAIKYTIFFPVQFSMHLD